MSDKIKLEEKYNPGDKALEIIAREYADFYEYRDRRDQPFEHIQGLTLKDYWTQSRRLFWNSMLTKSEDLAALGLDFSLPFVRKEVMDYVGRLVQMNILPNIGGDGMGMHEIRFLDALYRKWRLKRKDPIEKFWQMLYGVVNGTTCIYVGFDGSEREFRYMTEIGDDGIANYRSEKKKLWNDVTTDVVPVEEIYLEQPWQRDIQKQGKTKRMQEMTLGDFKAQFGQYPDAKYVEKGSIIAEDSLFHQLLDGTGILTKEKVQVLTTYDTQKDTKIVVANGVWVNRPKGSDPEPNPFSHKLQPYVWSINEAIDEKFAYGLSLPFKIKDPHKILNTSYTMMVERELREIDPPILSSDFEAPDMVFGQGKVVQVNDVQAYKELQIQPTSGAYQNFMNSMQGQMSTIAQGGFSQLAPSRQPRSAREVVALENLKQQSLGNALVMYKDMLFQELFLILKTMLQFYSLEQYTRQGEAVLRKLTIGDSPMAEGGIGNLEVRITKETSNPMYLYFEAVQRSIQTGKKTEIMEVSIDLINNLEFYVDNVKLEPEKSSELERSLFNEQILAPMLQTYVPMGIADIGKVFLRHMEKMGEHPADYTSNQVATNLMGGNVQASPAAPQTGAQTGNLMQSQRGQVFGGQSAMPVPEEVTI